MWLFGRFKTQLPGPEEALPGRTDGMPVASRHTVLGGAPRGRLVAVCGAIAGDLAAAPILIGLGVTELSAPPAAIPELKAVIRRLPLAQCRDLAERALAQASAADVRALALTP